MRVAVVVFFVAVCCACSSIDRSVVPATTNGPRVIDTAKPPPTLPPLSPGFTPARLSGNLHRERWDVDANEAFGGEDLLDDEFAFVALHDRGTRGHWIVDGRVGDLAVDVVIDTASSKTLVAPELAAQLGLTLSPGEPFDDASGHRVASRRAALPDVVVGGVCFRNLIAVVPDRALRPDLFLLGEDALAHIDLVVDGLAGEVAFVESGVDLAVVGTEAEVVELDVGDRWRVVGTAPGAKRLAALSFVVDTGSPLTSIPAAVGVDEGIAADVGRSAVLKGAGGDAVERRGRFLLWPLALGMLHVGQVSALETEADDGLLGTDVLGRSRVLFSPSRRALVFFAGEAGAGPRAADDVVVFTVADRGHGAFDVDVGDALGGEVHFVLRSHDRFGAWRGGAVDVVVTGAGSKVVDTGLDFDAGFSVLLLPKTGVPCPDGVCMRLLGDWPR